MPPPGMPPPGMPPPGMQRPGMPPPTAMAFPARALFAFAEGDPSWAPSDMVFQEGDVITVASEEPGEGWWTGSVAGVAGIFPSNYAEKILKAQLPESPAPAAGNAFPAAESQQIVP